MPDLTGFIPGIVLAAGPVDTSPLGTWAYFQQHSGEVLGLLWAHTWLSIVPVVAGLVLALPLGWLASRHPPLYSPMMSITGVLYTIPSIALFVLVPPLLGLDPLSPLQVPIALTLYSLALLVRVVADALLAVPGETLQAATALGYKPVGRFFRVELPIAVPVISTGLRVAVVANVSIVAIAGTIGMANLGSLFDLGFKLSTTSPYYPPIVLGIVLCVLLALALDGLIVLMDRALTPWRRAVR
ncbi:MAG: ABC transporter permease [Actinomycetales bacterium]